VRRACGIQDEDFLASVGVRQVLGSFLVGDLFSLSEQVGVVVGWVGEDTPSSALCEGGEEKGCLASQRVVAPAVPSAAQVSEGKSGAIFFWSMDGRYMIKCISKAESYSMRRMLASYKVRETSHSCEASTGRTSV
jgi:hypothetical protein